jgi:DNA-binding NtrC family response regulator
MKNRIRVLLVHDEGDPMKELNALLRRQGLETLRLRGCAEMERMMAESEPPHLIFTDTVLPDGTWADVKNLAATTHWAVPVIVVSRLVNLPLYLEALENGASDFIVPPFRDGDLAYVIESALGGYRIHAEPLQAA